MVIVECAKFDEGEGTMATSKAVNRRVDQQGATALRNVSVEYSRFASAEARQAFINEIDDGPITTDINLLRAHYGRFNDKLAAAMRAKYDVSIHDEVWGGVPVQRVVAANAPANPARLLINFHGGAFMWGAGSGALVEAIPIAAVTGMPVVTVDYRMAPEHTFPAATLDAHAVFTEARRRFDPAAIGVYGCSAGAVLVAQLIAQLHHAGDPLPGAAAMLGGGGTDFGGDSAILSSMLMGSDPDGGLHSLFDLVYMKSASPDDPLAVPCLDDRLLANFPPSLLITASRDFAASSVSHFHRRLVANGSDARLFMFDGLWHAFHIFSDLPESKEVYALMRNFFARNLKTS